MAITKIQDPDLKASLIAAPGSTTELQIEAVGPITLKVVHDSGGVYQIVTDAAGNEIAALRLLRYKQPESKATTRMTTEEFIADFVKRGGKIKRVDDAETNGMSSKDWARQQQGLKVATLEEIAAETERRALKAITAKNVELAYELLKGRYRKEIKFDIENDRLGPNGEIR